MADHHVMTKVECPMVTCKFISEVNGDHGICAKDKIWLKWRLAGDFGGKFFAVECLEFETDERNRPQ